MPKNSLLNDNGSDLLRSKVVADVHSHAAFRREGETMSEEGAMRPWLQTTALPAEI